MPAERIVAAIIERSGPTLRAELPADEADALLGRLARTSLPKLLALAASRVSGDESSLANAALQRIAERHGIDPAHVERAIELLDDGRFAEDLAGVTALTVDGVRSLPEAVASLAREPGIAIDLVPALFRDLRELPGDLADALIGGVQDLFRGDTPPAQPEQRERLLENTLGELYRVAPVDVARRWGHEVTGYDSVRLAILAYASSHGVAIDDADLDAARTALAEGDLAPLLAAGIAYFRREAPERLGPFVG